MNILILGHNGYLGSYLSKNIEADTLKERGVYYNGKEYNYIINCIGRANLEYCECHKEETDYCNGGLIKDINKYYPSAKIINFSSYYVYDDNGLCSEESKTTTKYNYCRQKLTSEKLVKNGVSFRLGKLFGHHDINKQKKLTEYIIKNNELTLDSTSFNPTSLRQVLAAVRYELKSNSLTGTFNLSNSGFTTHYDYGLFINKLTGNNKKIKKTKKNSRVFDNYGKFLMSCNKIKKHIDLTYWKDDVIIYINSLKKRTEKCTALET